VSAGGVTSASGSTGPAHDAELRARVERWIADDPDPTTREELAELLARGDSAGLEDRFARPLTFGTAGLRGALGAGPARMNRAVVRRTTAGLASWLNRQGDGAAERGIVVGRDARHGSAEFANDVAEVASALGVTVHELSRPLPTPVTAFALRHLDAAAGVMVTASHNPAPDNGYKVYLADGAQVIPPHNAAIAAAAASAEVPPAGTGDNARRVVIDEVGLLDAYRFVVLALVGDGGPRDLEVVYTPLHGVGGAVVPDLLVRAGFAAPRPVPAQSEPDPDFPTLPFPNPEEPGALDLAIAEAELHHADLVIANDPDADRLAIALNDPARRGWRALTGDELGILLADYLLERSSGSDRLVATTIVSSSMLRALAADRGVDYAETLTGFKWIARAATSRPGSRLVFGYEEALGYAVSDAVADKDGMSAAVVAAAMAAEAKAAGSTLLDRLDALAATLGVHETAQWSLRLEGSDGPARMARIVERWRSEPPRAIAGLAVSEHVDLSTDGVIVRAGGRVRVVVRPSGTEPKLKAYLEVTTAPPGLAELAGARAEAHALLAAVRDDVARRCSDG
jgi:phosphomannomutase